MREVIFGIFNFNKHTSSHILRSRDTHTQLLLAIFKGECSDGKGKAR